MPWYDQGVAVRRPPVPAFMVAGGGLPTAVLSADWARPRVLAAIVLLAMSASDPRSAAASLPLFLKERPLASRVASELAGWCVEEGQPWAALATSKCSEA